MCWADTFQRPSRGAASLLIAVCEWKGLGSHSSLLSARDCVSGGAEEERARVRERVRGVIRHLQKAWKQGSQVEQRLEGIYEGMS